MSNVIYTQNEKTLLILFGISAIFTCGLSFIFNVSGNPTDFMLGVTTFVFGVFMGSFHQRTSAEEKKNDSKS